MILQDGFDPLFKNCGRVVAGHEIVQAQVEVNKLMAFTLFKPFFTFRGRTVPVQIGEIEHYILDWNIRQQG